MINAMTSRMAGVPKAVADLGDKQLKALDDNIGKVFRGVFPMIKVCFFLRWVNKISDEEWLLRFPETKRVALIRESVEHAIIKRYWYDCFIKKEKSIGDGVLAKTVLDTGGEIPQTDEKMDARGISVPQGEIRVYTSTWCTYLNSTLHKSFSGRIKYVPGDTPKKLSQWFSEATMRVQSGDWPWAIAVQGDDSLILRKEEGQCVVYNTDFSRYDMSQRVAHFEGVWWLLEKLGVFVESEVAWVIKLQQNLRIYKNQAANLRVRGTMASGDGVTITFNSITLIVAVVSWLEEGGDLQEHMKNFGLAVTLTKGTMHQPLCVDFLQSRPWQIEGGGRVFGPKPGRILARFFWIPRKYTGIKADHRYRSDIASMAYGLLAVANHVPIVNDICHRILDLEEARGHRWDLEGPEELRKWRTGSWEVESEHSLQEMAGFYGVDFESLERLRQRCRQWNFGEAIDNDVVLSEVVALMVAKDSQ